MKGNEFDIFSELEHEIGRDLTQWRRRIVASFEKCCRAAMEIEEARVDPVDISDAAVYDSIKRHTIDFLIADWIEDKDSPHPTDVISVSGESLWYAEDDTTEGMKPFRLPAGYKIEGSLQHFDVMPYIDQAGLEARVHRDPELAYRHTHPFGLHLILNHPTITNDVGTVLPIRPEYIYLPIHYEQAKLRAYSDI